MIAKIDESFSALFPSMRPETSVRSASQITTIDTTTLSSCYLPCPGYRYPDKELYLGYSKDFFTEIKDPVVLYTVFSLNASIQVMWQSKDRKTASV